VRVSSNQPAPARGAGGAVTGTSATLRIAHVAPVATSVPPPRSGSVETMTSLLTEGLVARGHDVTLFATADSTTTARLHAIYPHGYIHDPHMWPWELYELLNLAAAVERAGEFDLVHYEAEYYPMSLAFARLSAAPVVQTLHYSPGEAEIRLWSRYPEAPFVAISDEQAALLRGLNVVGTVLHAVDTDALAFREQPDDYLLFLGRFTEGKGVLPAIEVAKRAGMRLILAAAENDYYRDTVAPHVDGVNIVYAGEADFSAKVALFGGARALLYPVQTREPFGLVLAEAMACGTPVAALDRGAVREVVDDGVTGVIFESVDALAGGVPRVCALDRRRVRERAVARFGVDRMVGQYEAVYQQVVEDRRVTR
jgi:glycosyltransferase involved in cell wall biosynthesis